MLSVQAIAALEKDVAALKSELAAREATISEKDARIAEIKKRAQVQGYMRRVQLQLEMAPLSYCL